jgi:AAA domain
LINLAVAAATGEDWLKFETVKTKVLYINLELHEDTFFNRLGTICQAMEIPIADVADNLSSWCLRGHAAGYSEILPVILNEIRDKGFGLVIFDPTYKILGELDENKAGDITKLMNALEEVCAETGAALVMAYHYSKGNKAASQDGDRTRGSGVFLADPDALLEFVPQSESDESNDILSVVSILREFRPVPSFCVKWDGRALFEVSGHDPKKLKKATGRPSSYSEKELLNLLGEDGMTATEWQKACADERGIPRTQFYALKQSLEKSGRVYKSKLDGGKFLKSAAETTSASVVVPPGALAIVCGSGNGTQVTVRNGNELFGQSMCVQD